MDHKVHGCVTIVFIIFPSNMFGGGGGVRVCSVLLYKWIWSSLRPGENRRKIIWIAKDEVFAPSPYYLYLSGYLIICCFVVVFFFVSINMLLYIMIVISLLYSMRPVDLAQLVRFTFSQNPLRSTRNSLAIACIEIVFLLFNDD